jgi:hypothetical protein
VDCGRRLVSVAVSAKFHSLNTCRFAYRIDALSGKKKPTTKEVCVAKKTIRVSDRSGAEIPEGKGASVRITFADARKGVRELDLTDAEAEQLGGRAVARRGRPKSKSVT